MTMNTKSKTFLVAALLLSSVAGALAFEGPQTIEEWNYVRNPNAPIPQYLNQPYAQSDLNQGRVIERRGIVATHSNGARPDAGWYDRNEAIDDFQGSR
jgi:hypothetical protein